MRMNRRRWGVALATASLVVAPSCVVVAALFVDSGSKRTASDADNGDGFGRMVAIDGSYAVVGASFNTPNGILSGAAYIFERGVDGQWAEALRVIPDDGMSGDFFGFSVGIDGETAIIGAEQDDGMIGSNEGSAYVYVRDVGGVWALEQKIQAPDASALDLFGFAVAVDADTALVTCMRDDDVIVDSGSVYVFVRDGGGVWSFQDKLLASNAAAMVGFGVSIDVVGDDAVVGAPQSDGAGVGFGSVYVYQRDGFGGWSEVVELGAVDGADGDQFGSSVAMVDGLIVVGAPMHDANGADAGAVYVFERNGMGQWSPSAKLMADVGVAGQLFGSSVSISGGLIVVGARDDDGAVAGAGAVYLFEPDGGGWTQADRLVAADGGVNDRFGIGVGVDGGSLIVGASGDDDGGLNAGAVYFFDLCVPDINKDGIVDTADLGLLLGVFGAVGANVADLNGDLVVDTADLGLLLGAFGQACP